MSNVEGQYVRVNQAGVGRIRSKDGYIFKFFANLANRRQRKYCEQTCPLHGRCQPESEVKDSPLSASQYFVRVKGFLAGTSDCGLVFTQRRR